MQARELGDGVGAVAQGRRHVLAVIQRRRGLPVEVFHGVALVIPVARLPVWRLRSRPLRAGAEDLAAPVRVVHAEPYQQAGEAGGPALAGAVPVQQGGQGNLHGLVRLAGLFRLTLGVRREQGGDIGGVVVSLAGVPEGCGAEAGGAVQGQLRVVARRCKKACPGNSSREQDLAAEERPFIGLPVCRGECPVAQERAGLFRTLAEPVVQEHCVAGNSVARTGVASNSTVSGGVVSNPQRGVLGLAAGTLMQGEPTLERRGERLVDGEQLRAVEANGDGGAVVGNC